VPKRKPILPSFADNEVGGARRQAQEGLAARLASSPRRPVETYEQRLAYELGIIEQMGFPGYFLIVADFIKWAKARASPWAPAAARARAPRGLCADHHRPRPLRYSLLFERFLNPERVSMPDFDIDFCMDRAER
jgi:DNA polymerase-3 subunit alpha